jgi:hypothetical protein
LVVFGMMEVRGEKGVEFSFFAAETLDLY